MTLGGSSGSWDDGKKKSLWSSAKKKDGGWGSGDGGGGTKKTYQGEDWDKWDEPPRSGSSHDFSKSDKKYTGSAKDSGWDFERPASDWRKWRPEVEETAKPDWEFGTDERKVTRIEDTIRSKD